MSEETVRLRGLRFGFPGRPLLRDVDLDLAPGEWVGIVGPNGIGKSAFLACLSGRLPSLGTLHVGGRAIRGVPGERAAAGVVKSFQDDPLSGELSPRRHLALVVASPERWLADAGLSEVADVPSEQLPRGLRRRLGLVLALCRQPKLLLLDEPLAGLIDADRLAALLLLDGARRARTAALWVEHDHALLEARVDRVLCLEEGRLVARRTAVGRSRPVPPRADEGPGGRLEIRWRHRGRARVASVPAGEVRRVPGLDDVDAASALRLGPGRAELWLDGRPGPRDPAALRRCGVAGVLDPPRLIGPLGPDAHLALSPWPNQARAVHARLLEPGLRRAPRMAWASGGEKRALALALALAGPTRGLVWAEARTGLSPETGRALDAILAERLTGGLSVLEISARE